MNIVDYTANYLLLPCILFILLFFYQKKISLTPFDQTAIWLNKRSLFSTAHLPSDQIILNLVRIVFGLVLSYRLYEIAIFVLPLNPSSIEVVALIMYAVLCFTLTLGILAPVSALLMLLYQLQFNFALHTYTLGNDVASMILLCFVLYPVGQVISVDAWLAKKNRYIKILYSWFLIKNRNTQVTLAKAISFFSYSLLCLYSVFLHLNDPLWLNGEAAVHLLSSSYLSRYDVFFQELFSENTVAVWAAKLSMIGMVLWYLFLMPAILVGGIARKLVITWAILFFLLSMFILQLSILPILEFLILLTWFWNLFSYTEHKSLNMLYDDRCNLCDKTVRVLRFVDIHNVIHYRPVSKNLDKAKMIGVNPDQLYQNLYSWEKESNRIYAGYDFYLHVSRKLVLLVPFFPILYFFKLIAIGPAIYNKVAKYRIQWFGVCKLPTNIDQAFVTPLFELPSQTSNKTNGFFIPFIIVALSYSLLFIAIMPINPFSQLIQNKLPDAVRSAHILSWTRINVFNKEDLGMTQHYYTVTGLNNDDSEYLLPLTGRRGERLNWHNSDRAYFGNTL